MTNEVSDIFKFESSTQELAMREADRNDVTNSSSQEVDPWAIVDNVDDSEKWSDMTTRAKIIRIIWNTTKIILALGFLYLFVCSLDLLSSAFRLIAGKTAGQIFQADSIATNPVVGLMAGILITVLVQSSSTSTSIVVSLVGAKVLTVRYAIPIIMGANIGTSVTNTIVSFSSIGNRNEFRRAFAGATVHDMFNWLSVIVLFPVEIITQNIFEFGYLESVSGAIVAGVNSSSGSGEIQLLKVITDPFIKLIIQLDSKVLTGWANNDPKFENSSLIRFCSVVNETRSYCSPAFIFENTSMKDWGVGLILLFVSLFTLCACLICLVKVLNSMMKGHIANIIKRVINSNIPYVPWLTGYLAIAVGTGLTFLVQSSSVFTSTLTPLVGVGVISLKRVYPLTLGSNIGTTTTALLAALATSGDRLHDTLQISLCHLFFNLTGIVLFYPIPFTRLPIPMAKFLGNTTAKYRWFAIVYLIGMFFILPGIVLGVSFGGTIALLCVGVPVLVVIVAIAVIKILQRRRPKWLPPVLRTWKWLPEPMRSLAPYDRLFARCGCCNKYRGNDNKEPSSSVAVVVVGKDNPIMAQEEKSTEKGA